MDFLWDFCEEHHKLSQRLIGMHAEQYLLELKIAYLNDSTFIRYRFTFENYTHCLKTVKDHIAQKLEFH